ncbi:Type 1 glutamine amidotransferase-like domain-containing protein [Myxococcaceae bacterium JPH2]|nr:Type 1 glutamine amidotransferase-like domain-containing protein [Myxococcaceae bacterium JPH2]
MSSLAAPTPPPLFLFADSALLFWRVEGRPFLDCLRVLTGAELRVPPVRAAYLGASNGDVPAFYEVFTAAMEGIGITHCRAIPASPTPQDLEWLAHADIVLLAGGDPRVGWEAFRAHGVDALLQERHRAGAVLMGVSAGAMQLGQGLWGEPLPMEDEPLPTLGLAPFLVGVHEAPEWPGLRRALQQAGYPHRALGIPLGGGLLVHADGSIEPIRHPVIDLGLDPEGRLHESLLLPPVNSYQGERPAPAEAPKLLQ